MSFNAREAKLLQAGSHIIVDGFSGLRLVAAATRKTWTYRYKDAEGRMKQVALGHWPAMSVGEAVTEWERVRAVRDAGDDPRKVETAARKPKVQAPGPVEKIYTVGDLISDYLDGHIDKKRKPKGAKEVRRLLERHLKQIELAPAATLTRAQAFGVIEAMQETPVLAAQIKQEMGGAWDYALDAGRLPDTAVNWWRLIMRGRLKSKGKKVDGKHIGVSRRALSSDEVGVLLRWMPNFSRLVGDILTLYLWTGCRGGELVQIEVGEVTQEPDGWWWTCPKSKTKNERHETAGDLRVPLVGRAMDIVLRRCDVARQTGKSYIFPSERGVMPHTQQKVIQVAIHWHMPYSNARPEEPRARLMVTHWSPHYLRRTVRTELAALGCPDAVAESVLGHVQQGIQGVYNVHNYDKERRVWLTRLSERWEECARLSPGAASSLPQAGI